jgi:hypothetical protein
LFAAGSEFGRGICKFSGLVWCLLVNLCSNSVVLLSIPCAAAQGIHLAGGRDFFVDRPMLLLGCKLTNLVFRPRF